jgi:SAM-dependent methyltransferase
VAERESRTFDRLVQETGDFNPFTDRGWRTLARRFTTVRGTGAPATVLDIGCGTGHSYRVYASAATRYCGADLSFGALRLARHRLPARDWLQADACRLPFEAASFDVAGFSSVLHHIPDRLAALAEARRILKPGGLLFAFDPNLLHPAMALFRHPRSPFYSSVGVSPDERPLLPRTLRREIASSGFIGVGQRCQSDIPYRAVAQRGLNRLLKLYNAVDWVLEGIGLGRWFGSFVVSWGRLPEADT